MARGLGELIVSLGLNTAEFSRGLTKAELDAQRFSQRVNSAILQVGKVLGTLEIGRELFSATKDIIAEASALSDLAQATGSTVESLSRLTNQAKIAGSDLATVETALLKLSKGMAGTDAESTKTKEALKLLGVTTRDPVQALEEASVALDKFQNGVNKVGLAAALFGGKDGQVFLKVMQDIAQQQGVVATTTQKQADDAKNLEIAIRTLSVEYTAFKNVILNDVVPALTDMIREFTASIKIAGGLFDALRLFSGLDLSNPQKQIERIGKTIEDLEKQKTTGGLFSGFNNQFIQGAIEDAKKQLELAKFVRRQRAGNLNDQSNFDARDLRLLQKPEAPFIAAAGGAGKSAKDKASETDALVKSLESQLQATLELNAEDTAQVAIFNLLAKGVTDLDEATKALILDYARQIDQSKEAKKAADEARRAADEDARIRDHIAQTIVRQVEAEQREAQSIKDGNDAIREQIAFLTGGEEAFRKLRDAKDADTLAQKENLLAVTAGKEGQEAQTAALEESIRLLKERQAVLKEFDVAKKFAEEKKALDDFKNAVGDTFANAFEGFITGTKTAKDAFKSFVADIESALVRLALKKLMNKILGVSDTGGPDIFDIAAKFLGLWAGAGTGTGIANIGAGGSGGLAFAANGSEFTRGGKTVVGEHGVEIVDMPRGARVIPLNRTRGGNSYHQEFHINVLPGATNASVRQAKAQLRDAVMSSMRDR